jgi:hypothetical protein
VPGRAQPLRLGRTETIDNNLSPVWVKTFDVDYRFEARQEFRADLFDDDGPNEEPDALGSVSFTLGEVMGARAHTCTKPVSIKGTLTICAAEASSRFARDTISLSISAKRLPTAGLFGGAGDYYYRIWSMRPNGSRVKIHRSEVLKSVTAAQWADTPPLSAGDLTSKATSHAGLRLEVFETGVLVAAAKPEGTGPFRLSNGAEVFMRATVNHLPTFVELLGSGLQLNLNVAIDFTSSNGDPSQATSLHYSSGRPGQQTNQYTRAISSVGEVLIDYDTDKMVPVLGFGALLPSGQVSHCFNVNGEPQPFVHGVDGVLSAYRRCLSTVRLHGPTNFAPVIRYVSNAARALQDTYSILLIITDGEITDMDDTIGAIVGADALPLSIIIVGVGRGCDFKLMDQLDGDEERLAHRGRIALRDLVQFVPFRDFESAPSSVLAAAVLEELPRQVEEWAQIARYAPRPLLAPAPADVPVRTAQTV